MADIHTLIDAIQQATGQDVHLIVHTGDTWTAKCTHRYAGTREAEGGTAVEALTHLAIEIQQEALSQIENADVIKATAAETLERLTPALTVRGQ